MPCSKYLAPGFLFLIEKGFYYQRDFGNMQLLHAQHHAWNTYILGREINVLTAILWTIALMSLRNTANT